jgi:hypothetical protein
LKIQGGPYESIDLTSEPELNTQDGPPVGTDFTPEPEFGIKSTGQPTEDSYLTPEHEFKVKPKKNPYEDTNDMTFVNEYYEINKSIGSDHLDNRNGRTEMSEQVELSNVFRNTSKQNLLKAYCDISFPDKRSKKGKSPYESCNSVSFLKEYA